MGKFEWDLERVGNAHLAFSEEFDTGEIELYYNTSLRDATIQLFEWDCSTSIPLTVATASGIAKQSSLRHANLTVSIDIAQDNVTSYPSVWTDVATGEGLITMCVRVDLLQDIDGVATSVHFHEQRLRVTVGLLQGFEVGAVDLLRVTADEEDGDADVDYELIACQCSESFECLTTTLTQGSEVFICVKSLADGVEIIGIQALSFSQGSYSVNSIVEGEEDQFTTVTMIDNKAFIRNQMLSVFFEQFNPEDVIAEGFALLGFTESNGRRRLLRKSIKNRVLDTVTGAGDMKFSVSLAVESSLKANSGASGGSVLSVMTIMIGIAVLVA